MGILWAWAITTFGPLAITLFVSIASCSLFLLLLVTMIGQVSTSELPSRAKAGWIALAVVLPLVSTALWYFFGPRPLATEQERESAEELFAQFADAA